MAAVVASGAPLSAKEKKREHLKSFGELLKRRVAVFHALVTINQAVGGLEKGQVLLFSTPDGSGAILNRKLARSMNAKFAHDLLSLKLVLRDAYKGPARPKLPPSSFKGVYVPSYAGPALQYFFKENKEGFGYLDPRNPASGLLMDSLGMVQQGVLLRNTITMLFYTYSHASNLQDARDASFSRADAHMTAAFGGQIAASHYPVADANGKSVNIPMAQAVAEGRIANPMNTFEILTERFRGHVDKKGRPSSFEPARLHNYFTQNIYALNYFSRQAAAATPDIAGIVTSLDAPDVRAAMLQEHDLVSQNAAVWGEILKPERDRRRAEKAAIKKAADKAAKAAGVAK
jgi:hypothetical protein